MPFRIIRNDITKVKADAIVNTANPKPVIGGGTDSAIYQAAGKEALLKERQKIGNIVPGDAVNTDAFALDAKYIFHTVGPAWIDGKHGEKDILHSCYQKSLALAKKLKCKSIAFPLIATGVYGFPKDEALNIALEEIGKFLLTDEMKIILVVFDMKALELSKGLMGEIDQYIDEHYVERTHEIEYGNYQRRGNNRSRRVERIIEEERYEVQKNLVFGRMPDMKGKNLSEVLDGAGGSFRQKLFELIDQKGLDDVTVYKRANITRKVFSTIRCKKDYTPSKKTALSLALALKLDMPETTDLLARAGITLTPDNKADLVIAYHINNNVYDVLLIDAELFKRGLPTLSDYGEKRKTSE